VTDQTGELPRNEVVVGDCVEVMAGWPAESIDAIVCDPPYGLEFMGKEWDAFRLDDPGTMRHRGEHLGGQGTLKAENDTLPAAGRVEYGAGKRPTTSRCSGCGKRDQFRNPHACDPATSKWITEPIDRYAAPPTSLAFGEWCRTWALEAYRVAKPGAHILAFGGTRTYHRLVSGLEDAGWEIRDCLVWAYAQGFPKSLNVSKAIDRLGGAAAPFADFRDACLAAMATTGVTRRELADALGNAMLGHYLTAGSQPAVPNRTDYLILRDRLELGDRFDALFLEEAEREVVGERDASDFVYAPGQDGRGRATLELTTPATAAAQEWQGWGTALKPAWEPIVMARKPLSASVAVNVLTHGTGALNIDGTRIPISPEDAERIAQGGGYLKAGYVSPEGVALEGSVDGSLNRAAALDPRTLDRVGDAEANELGRWPANLALTDPIFDGDVPGVIGGGETDFVWTAPSRGVGREDEVIYGRGLGQPAGETPFHYADAGTYSRFFLIPKATRQDREPVVRGQVEARQVALGNHGNAEAADPDPVSARFIAAPRENTHPTVKPTELMRHLVRLVTPPGGIVVDPFLGSGTTAVAAEAEGFTWIGIERDPESAAISRARLIGNARGLGLDVPAPNRRRAKSKGHWPAKRSPHAGVTFDGFFGQDELPERTA
jgi:DNA modification methylase